MKNRLYGIRVTVNYGQYLHVVSAKSRKEAIKILLSNPNTSQRINLKERVQIQILKPTANSKTIMVGGTEE